MAMHNLPPLLQRSLKSDRTFQPSPLTEMKIDGDSSNFYSRSTKV